MSLPRFLLQAAVTLVCLFSLSCIDGREEFWLDADGGGRASLSYELPAIAARAQGGEEGIREMVSGFLTGNPAFRSSSHEVTTEGDRLRVKVDVAFDSALDLGKLGGDGPLTELPSSASHLAGQLEIRANGRRVEMTRTVSPGKALPGSFLMPASKFEGRRLIYIIHLPEPALDTNATEVTNGGRTLIWDHSLYDGICKPIVTRFTADMPIPKTWIVAACGAGILVATALTAAVLKLRRRR